MPAKILRLDQDEGKLRENLRLITQAMIEWEVSAAISAVPYERRPERRTQRNGYRQRLWHTRIGQITLHIPKLRKGAYYPAFLDELPRAEPLLVDLAREAWDDRLTAARLREVSQRLGLLAVHPSQIADLLALLHDLNARTSLQSAGSVRALLMAA